MRICFVSHSADKHGAELVLVEIVDALQKRGVECIVVAPEEGSLPDELVKRGVTVYILPYRWWSSPGRSIRDRIRVLLRNLIASAKLARYLRAHRCDAVYTNTIVVPVGAFAAVLAAVPHVWHIQEFGELDHGLKFDWGERLSVGLISKLSAVCITNSVAVSDYFSRSINLAKLRLVYYSMHLAGSRNSDRRLRNQNVASCKNAFRCVLVGRICESKGQRDAVLALAELAKIGIQVELYLVGNGSAPYVDRLQELVGECGLNKQVVFAGRLDNPAEVVATADVVLMCSRSEAFGRVTIEGMLAAKPLIGARGGATPELVREGFNGLLYSPGSAHELATQIRYLYDNRAEAVRMGENGLKWAQSKFSENQLAEDLIGVLSRISGRAKIAEGGVA